MGWSNYLVLPKYKLAFEISRYVDDLNHAKEVEDVLYDASVAAVSVDLNAPYDSLTLEQLADLIRLAKILNHIDEFITPNIGIRFLLEYDKTAYIVHENEAYILQDKEG